MYKFKSNVIINGEFFGIGSTHDSLPVSITENAYFKSLVEIGDIVEEKPVAKNTKSKE
jgi:hypothetical protein